MARRPQGFTLIEVLIALVLVSVMALLAWRGVEGMSRAAHQTQAYEADAQRLETTLAQWRADLDALIDTGLVKALDFDGQRLRLTRSSNEPSAGVVVVAWTLQAGKVERFAAPVVTDRSALQAAWLEAERWGRTPLPEDAKRTASLIPAVSWQVFYFRGDAWSNPLSSGAGAAVSGSGVLATRESMPDGVRLIIELPAASSFAGKLTRDWVQPALGATR
jgi:general secretion pathway protein J